MPTVTPYTDLEKPRHREPLLNIKMQGFVDKLTTLTVPEINNAVAGATAIIIPQLAPIYLLASANFDVDVKEENQIQTYYCDANTAQNVTILNADSVENLTTHEAVAAGSLIALPVSSILHVWWETDGGGKRARFFFASKSATEGGGGGGGTPIVPDYTVIDIGTIDYTVADYA